MYIKIKNIINAIKTNIIFDKKYTVINICVLINITLYFDGII